MIHTSKKQVLTLYSWGGEGGNQPPDLANLSQLGLVNLQEATNSTGECVSLLRNIIPLWESLFPQGPSMQIVSYISFKISIPSNWAGMAPSGCLREPIALRFNSSWSL